MMRWRLALGMVLATRLAVTFTADAQEIPPPRPFVTQPRQEMPQPVQEVLQPELAAPGLLPSTNAGSGLEAESLPGELAEDIYQATDALRLGPTAVSNVRFLMDGLGLENWLAGPGIRTFGWVEGGYTGASTGRGLALGPDPAEPLRR